MGNCNNCDCNKEDGKYEYDDNKGDPKLSDEPITIAQKKAMKSQMGNSQQNGLRFTFQKRDIPPLQSLQREQLQIIAKNNIQDIIKIQSLWRSYRARLLTGIIKKEAKLKKKYFLDEELYETLSKVSKYSKSKFVMKEYVYKSTGSKYTGEWKGGFRHGSGLMEWADGAKYDGQWMLGHAQGKGKFIHTKGEMYEGQWYHDKAHGYGVYTHSNGAKYEGEWLNDLQHGKGTETWPDNSLFVGEYRDGKKNGVGKYVWGDGASYEGEWEENEIAGCGYYQWNDGRKYLGHWRGNVMEEFGIYTWQDGRMYEGFYLDDKKHGYGIYTWSDSKRYAGWWSNGKQHGLGIFISKEGKKKLGVWEDGKKLRWLSQDDVVMIEEGQLDLKGMFENQEESWQKIKEFPQQFQPPQDYYTAKQRIINKINEMKIQVSLSESFQQSADQGNQLS